MWAKMNLQHKLSLLFFCLAPFAVNPSSFRSFFFFFFCNLLWSCSISGRPPPSVPSPLGQTPLVLHASQPSFSPNVPYKGFLQTLQTLVLHLPDAELSLLCVFACDHWISPFSTQIQQENCSTVISAHFCRLNLKQLSDAAVVRFIALDLPLLSATNDPHRSMCTGDCQHPSYEQSEKCLSKFHFFPLFFPFPELW